MFLQQNIQRWHKATSMTQTPLLIYIKNKTPQRFFPHFSGIFVIWSQLPSVTTCSGRF